MSDQTIDRQVEVVVPEHTSRALKALTLAFATDPPTRWLFPESEVYARHFAEFALAFGGDAITDGTALEIEGHAGVALWMSPGIGPDEGALLDVIERSVPAPCRARVHDLLAEMGRLHPSGDHWYLPLIGVDPRRQGAGLGSALLRPALRAPMPCRCRPIWRRRAHAMSASTGDTASNRSARFASTIVR